MTMNEQGVPRPTVPHPFVPFTSRAMDVSTRDVCSRCGAPRAHELHVEARFDDMVIAMENAAHKLLDSSEDQSSYFYETILRAALAAAAVSTGREDENDE